MKRVAEIIYIVEEQREAFLQGVLHPDQEMLKVQWLCGVRKQQYFALNDLLFMTFEYAGDHFAEDMKKMAAYLETRGFLVEKRRKEVPVEERTTTNWWAPVKRLGDFLESKPDFGEEEDDEDYATLLDGCMTNRDNGNDIAYDEEDWMEEVRIW